MHLVCDADGRTDGRVHIVHHGCRPRQQQQQQQLNIRFGLAALNCGRPGRVGVWPSNGRATLVDDVDPTHWSAGTARSVAGRGDVTNHNEARTARLGWPVLVPLASRRHNLTRLRRE